MNDTAAVEPGFVYDPFSRAAMENPLPFYKVLRDEYPLYFLPQYDTYVLSRFDDVFELLADMSGALTGTEGTQVIDVEHWRTHHNDGAAPPPIMDPLSGFTALESPVYEEIRQAAGRPLRPGHVKRLEELVRAICRARLDELVPRGRFDIRADYAGIVSASTMCHLVGLPTSFAERLLDLINSITRRDPDMEGSLDNFTAGIEEFIGVASELVERRRATGPDGRYSMVDGLIQYRLDGRPLTDYEIAWQLFVIVGGGTETVPKVVAHGLMELWRHPDQRREVAADGANSKVAFDEVVRYCGPAQWFARTLTRDLVVRGEQLRAGQRLILGIASANRDDREFEDPDSFAWDRNAPRQIAFGHGQHYCIGVHLAKLEGRVMIEELLARLPEYEIDMSGAVRPPSDFQWGWMHMPLVVA